MSRVFVLAKRILIVVASVAFAGDALAQQSYPSKPIRFIVPFAPGGSTSIVARFIGQKLTESWGQQVLVDNRPGGNTIIGTEALAKSVPDGYTIILVQTNHVINPLLLPKLPYDSIRDFAAVATVARGEYVLVINPSLSANNLQELIALAKSKPGQINYASAGAGGPTHLATELLNLMADIKTQHIPYKGSAPALIDVISGQVQMYLASPGSTITYIKSGRLKPIAVSGEARLSTLPQVPTFTESGIPGFEVRTWYGILAPAGTTETIVEKISKEVARIVQMPEVREELVAQGVEPFATTPEQFAAIMKADLARYAKVIKAANIKIDQ